jgi:hypothetical protein
MHRSLPALIVAAGLLGALPVAHAQWMWKDKGGSVHVSDRPPPADVADKDIIRRPSGQRAALPPAPAAPASPAASGTATADAKARTDPELEARRKRAEQEQAEQRKQAEERIAAARAENCRRAQEHLRTVDSGARMSRTNEKGEREVLDDQQRAAEGERARAIIASDCR